MDFNHESVTVIRGPDVYHKIHFSFKEGLTEKAAIYLANLVENGSKLMLHNDEDEGGEGCTSISFKNNVFQCQSGGHGWQGKGQSLPKDKVIQLILDLAKCNMGGHWSTEANIVLTRP